MAGFQSPNYTQVPNDLFERLGEFDKTDLKVLLVIIRGTFGYHRHEVKISTREMADLTGLSIASIEPAAQKLIQLGLIEKIVDGNKTISWRAVVSDSTIGTRKKKSVSTIESPATQPLVHGDSTIESLSGLNKDKEIKINNDDPKPTVYKLYEQNIGVLVPMVANQLELAESEYPYEWIEKAFKLAVENNARSWSYVSACLANMKIKGVDWSPRKKEQAGVTRPSGGQSVPVEQFSPVGSY